MNTGEPVGCGEIIELLSIHSRRELDMLFDGYSLDGYYFRESE